MITPWKKRKFPESRLAHKYLDGLDGLEIGGSAHNPFGLKTKNVDFTGSMETVFKEYEQDICGKAMPVDIVAQGNNLPVPDESYDFIVSSHVLEHFPDPIKALKEWYRVIRKGGYIFMIVPHKERMFDRKNKRTTLNELIKRHENNFQSKEYGHFSVWITEDIMELINYLGWKIVEAWDVDDKVGNGFVVVVQKTDEKFEGKKVKIFKPSIFWKLSNRFNIILRSFGVNPHIFKK
jgi:SAM-dependent methyltransferase